MIIDIPDLKWLRIVFGQKNLNMDTFIINCNSVNQLHADVIRFYDNVLINTPTIEYYQLLVLNHLNKLGNATRIWISSKPNIDTITSSQIFKYLSENCFEQITDISTTFARFLRECERA